MKLREFSFELTGIISEGLMKHDRHVRGKIGHEVFLNGDKNPNLGVLRLAETVLDIEDYE